MKGYLRYTSIWHYLTSFESRVSFFHVIITLKTCYVISYNSSFPNITIQKPVCIGTDGKQKQSARLKVTFTETAVDVINIGNILYQEVIVFHIPPDFKDVSLPNISNEQDNSPHYK